MAERAEKEKKTKNRTRTLAKRVIKEREKKHIKDMSMIEKEKEMEEGLNRQGR